VFYGDPEPIYRARSIAGPWKVLLDTPSGIYGADRYLHQYRMADFTANLRWIPTIIFLINLRSSCSGPGSGGFVVKPYFGKTASGLLAQDAPIDFQVLIL
jgi:hypothetical protein